jgi:hypothetical protein
MQESAAALAGRDLEEVYLHYMSGGAEAPVAKAS